MRLFTLILLFVLVGCVRPPSNDLAQVAASSNPTRLEAECRSALPIPEGDGLELVLNGVARARTNDLRCGAPDDRTRVCRALFVLATLDPALHLNQPDDFDRVFDAVHWALVDAHGVAPIGTAEALERVIESLDRLAAAADDAGRAAALAIRLQPRSTEPLDDHWNTNCR